jgi:DNA-binding IclR family transcriptional regulator
MMVRDKILEVVSKADRPVTTAEVARATLTTPSNAGWILNKLAAEGLIQKSKGSTRAGNGHRWRVKPPQPGQSQGATV